MRASRLVGVVLVALVASTAAAVTSAGPAVADPTPGLSENWPYCGEGGDDDGRYCIVSVTRNGVPVASSDPDEVPYVDLIGPGDIRFGLTNVPDPSNGEVDPSSTWRVTVSSGAVEPWAVVGAVARNLEMSVGGGGSSHTFTLTFRPTPIAHTTMVGCHWDSGCGDDTTVADQVYDGFVTGYVTDGHSVFSGTGLRPYYEGYVEAYNAQDALVQYDEPSDSLVVRLANPHLKGPGVPATGYYDTFLPDGFLTGLMRVPDPGRLRGGSFVVTRSSGSSSVPFSVTREPGGVRLTISSIGFSTPVYRIRTKPTAPGVPRKVKVRRTGEKSVKVTFKAPLADGGKRVVRYKARCRRGSGPWQDKSGTSSPIRFAAVDARTVKCQVRAVNAKGSGDWSKKRPG